MARILVAGNINHDRIWHLDRPLVAGERLSCKAREVRLGGGGFYTGNALLALGHTVTIASTLMDDETGREALATLGTLGFDTAQVTMLAGETAPADILLDPHGERTIIAPPNRQRQPIALTTPATFDAIYVNATDLAPSLLAAMAATPLCVAQFPLKGGQRPADILIASAADLAGHDIAGSMTMARQIAGGRLSQLVVTDGPDPVRIHGTDGSHASVSPPDRLVLSDTIGAGDIFAGACLHAVLAGESPPQAALFACRFTEERLIERQRTFAVSQAPPT